MPTLSALLWPFFDAVVMVVALIALTRFAGLRSFSKMSGYDFAITVAMGSVLASVIVTKSTGPLVGIAALAALFAVQAVLSHLRVGSERAADAMDNAPLLIMRGSQVLEDNLAAAKMTRADLMAKLREANVLQLETVQAVIFEQTGDVSVMHGECAIDDEILQGVRATI
ncbi:DUF421 domain-containing protein [Sulfitobacter aestuariivivens]|uniref:DUF421 domain-containing protein n=1 Tax=Sulfitobacter aestuariivivens TaxID=2766981 RepID=A0A927D374_9RHOB|nr:YetF domain-containing protein [Sulfitobacter aestuariivivens]MBD3663074.1 DUF421 domain-containing protein [Sulfitobacter aestuariivivens]